MLTLVNTSPKSFEDYRSIIGDQEADEIQRLAERFRGARILHINATAFGGGVAEILNSLVPLSRDLGMSVEWQIIQGADEFYQVTKALHNSLQGMEIPWTRAMWEVWEKYNLLNADLFDGEYDYVVVHDPQPAGLLHYLRQSGRDTSKTRWVWRCHIDSTDAQREAWEYLTPYVQEYDAAIFTLQQFVPQGLSGPDIWVIPPAIDPLSAKNVPISEQAVDEVLVRFHIDPTRPLIVQAARLDAWKDPLGVLETYLQVKRQVPDVQLAMPSAIADDDPEGWHYYEQVMQRAGDDPDVHILPNILHGIGDLEVNAFQTGSRVVLQKSTREGFGLAVTEALWKERPVVGGNVGGIPLQVMDGETGYLVSSPTECAERIVSLLQNPERTAQMGRRAKEHVRENFLVTRLLKDYLQVFKSLSKKESEVGMATHP